MCLGVERKRREAGEQRGERKEGVVYGTKRQNLPGRLGSSHTGAVELPQYTSNGICQLARPTGSLS